MTFPGRTLREGAFLGLSRSLGGRFVELVWEGFLTPWAVDQLTVGDGRVASWPSSFFAPSGGKGVGTYFSLKLGGAKLL